MPDWLVTVLTVLVSNVVGGAVVYGSIREKLKTIEQEIGTRDTGLRGAVHSHSGALLKLDGRVTNLEEKRRDAR